MSTTSLLRKLVGTATPPLLPLSGRARGAGDGGVDRDLQILGRNVGLGAFETLLLVGHEFSCETEFVTASDKRQHGATQEGGGLANQRGSSRMRCGRFTWRQDSRPSQYIGEKGRSWGRNPNTKWKIRGILSVMSPLQCL